MQIQGLLSKKLDTLHTSMARRGSLGERATQSRNFDNISTGFHKFFAYPLAIVLVQLFTMREVLLRRW